MLLLALSDAQRQWRGPGFGLIDGCLSHGGFLAELLKLLQKEARERAYPPSRPCRTSLGPSQAFPSWRQQPQLQPAGGESGWMGLALCAGLTRLVTIGLRVQQDRVISRSQTGQFLTLPPTVTLLHMLAGCLRSQRWRDGGDFCEVQPSEITNLACHTRLVFYRWRCSAVLVYSTVAYHFISSAVVPFPHAIWCSYIFVSLFTARRLFEQPHCQVSLFAHKFHDIMRWKNSLLRGI